MRSELGKQEEGLTNQIRKRIARVAFERMEQECEADFRFLSGFRTDGTNRFLAWIRGIKKPQQAEAALSITCRQLQLRHIKCKNIPNFESWTGQYRDFPLNEGFDFEWQPKRHANKIASLVKNQLAPIRVLGPQAIELTDENPLAVPEIRAGLEMNTKLADIVLLQFLRPGLFDVSYVALLGLGQTGWRVQSAEECEGTVAGLAKVIGKAHEVVGVE